MSVDPKDTIIEELETKLSDAETQRDGYKDELDTANDRIKTLENGIGSLVDDLVDQRKKVEEAGDIIGSVIHDLQNL